MHRAFLQPPLRKNLSSSKEGKYHPFHEAGMAPIQAFADGVDSASSYTATALFRPEDLNHGDFAPHGTSGNIWRHFWFSKLGAGRWGGWGGSYPLVEARDAAKYHLKHSTAPQQRLTRPKMSIVPRTRNSGLHQMTAHCHGLPGIAGCLTDRLQAFGLSVTCLILCTW